MDDDDQLRWGLAIILGGCFASLPLLTGSLDLAASLIIWAIGAVGGHDAFHNWMARRSMSARVHQVRS